MLSAAHDFLKNNILIHTKKIVAVLVFSAMAYLTEQVFVDDDDKHPQLNKSIESKTKSNSDQHDSESHEYKEPLNKVKPLSDSNKSRKIRELQSKLSRQEEESKKNVFYGLYFGVLFFVSFILNLLIVTQKFEILVNVT